MVWEGKEVIKTGRGLIGATNPLGSAPGTIRGDFGIDLGRNIIHGSGRRRPLLPPNPLKLLLLQAFSNVLDPGDPCLQHPYSATNTMLYFADSVDSAQKEIALWFRPDELADYSATIAGWVYEARSKL